MSDSADETSKPELIEDSQSSNAASRLGGTATLNTTTEIYLGKELPDYNIAHLKAYSAQSGGVDCFAIMTDGAFSPRIELCDHYKQINNPDIPFLMDFGLAFLENGAPAGYFIVYKSNLGKRIYDGTENLALGWKPEHVLGRIFFPIISILKELHLRDMVHGNIRSNNLYNGNETDWSGLKTGDFLSLPPSYIQPVIYEPIERGMADPLGRGKGTPSDDLYALGVLMAMHLRSFDPLRGKTDREIISAKVIHGSYSAIVGGNDKFSGPILELLRGLLIDDAKQRWDMNEISAWIDGRRLTPKQNVKNKKAARALTFKGTSYYYAPTLAFNLHNDPQDAAHIVENNELTHWVERSLSDEDMAHRLNNAILGSADESKGPGYIERLLPRVSIALDPSAPIHYKNMSFFMDGFGKALAHALITNINLSKFRDFFKDNIHTFWIRTLSDMSMDVSHTADQMDKASQFLKSVNLLGGIERCLYFLNKSVHCLSPLVQKFYVRDAIQYINALERYASENQDSLPDRIIDKHAACFLAERDRRVIEPYVYDLSAKEPYRYILANMQVLASIQKFNSLGEMPNITKWLAKRADPLVERFHSAETRKKVKAELESKKSSGKIKGILEIFDNPQRIRDDQIAFHRALRDYQETSKEVQDLEIKMKNPKYYAEKSGREWAVTISGIVATLIILGFITVHFGTDRPY